MSAREASADQALEWIDALAGEIGPRRPTGRAEAIAAQWVRERLEAAGVTADELPFTGPSTFATSRSIPLALGVAAGLAPRGPLRSLLGAKALLLGLLEDDPRLAPLERILGRSPSRCVVAPVEPTGPAERTLCLVSHLDSSRSGLMFHPALAPHLRHVLALVSAAVAVQAADPLLGRSAAGRAAVRVARGTLVGGLALLAERELRGEDVPGANDNASGVAVAAAATMAVASEPLESTRLVFLATGCEESGTGGMRAFRASRDTSGWLFLNLDGVAAPATLRYLPREGVGRVHTADTGLISVAERVREEQPELGLEPATQLAGLIYDTTQVLAAGGRALTLSAQDATIPNYHTPADSPENTDPDVVDRALQVTMAMIEAIDDGEADVGAGDARRSLRTATAG
jgi:acetylornithine deacetylase/succinyl-diaminopimelate desuccinylase-like protein